MLKLVVTQLLPYKKPTQIRKSDGTWRDLLPEEDLKCFTCSISEEDTLITNQKFLFLERKDAKQLIVFFHGYMENITGDHGQFDIPLKRSSIVFPQDTFGINYAGSWHLGNLASYKDQYIHPSIFLVKGVLEHIKTNTKIDTTIFAGSCAGGFGAICHSVFNKVDQVYLSIPQTTLNPNCHCFNRGKPYWKKNERSKKNLMNQAIEYILPPFELDQFEQLLQRMPYLDANHFLKYITTNDIYVYHGIKLPLNIPKYFHLIGTRYAHHEDKNGAFMKEMYIPFINSLSELKTNFSIDILPIAGHDQYFYPHNIENFIHTHAQFLSPEKIEALGEKTPCNVLRTTRLLHNHIYLEE